MPTPKESEFLKKDLYGILEVPPDASEKVIIKAYKKKALRYHPDKNPDNPRAAELFQEVYEVCEILKDPAFRAAYDKLRQAKEKASERTRVLDSKRKKFKEDLEAREQKFNEQTKREEEKEAEGRLKREVERLRTEGSRLLEQEQQRLREELKNSATSSEGGGETGCATESGVEGPPRLKLKWSAKKGDADNGGYNTTNLTNIFSCYGNISALIVSSKRNGSAIAEFDSCGVDATVIDETGLSGNPFSITWLSGKPKQSCSTESENMENGKPSLDCGSDPLFSDGEGNTSVNFMSGTNVSAAGSGIFGSGMFASNSEGRDFENLVLRRMRQAEERKKLIQQMAEQDEAGT